jgi:hypothetical protein
MRSALLAVAAAFFFSSIPASSALANGPVHIKRTFPPQAADYAAGEVCDFNYHLENVLTVNIKRFYDANGLVDHAVRQEDLWVLHKNADTGLTYTEVDHYTLLLSDPAFCDSVPSNSCFWWQAITSSGQNWHLRDMDGKLVLVRSGRFIQDGNTGEILWATPKGDPDFVNTICKALGGAPAP